MRPEYRREDLGEGVRGKYHEAYRKGTFFEVAAPNSDVNVDSVRLMRRLREEISKEIDGMSYEEERCFIQEHLKEQEPVVKEKKSTD